MRGAARTLLSPSTTGSRSGTLSGTLSGCAFPQTGGAGRIEATGAEAASRAMAAQLRQTLAGSDRAARKAKRNQANDRSTQAFTQARATQIARGDRIGSRESLL